jgi:hypothetical protein
MIKIKKTKNYLQTYVLQKGEKVPDNTWTYIDSNGNKRATPFQLLVFNIASEFDNAANRDGRKYSDETIQMVQNKLIQLGIEYVPNINSLDTYLNINRLYTLKKSKGSKELSYQNELELTIGRNRTLKALTKK